MSQVCIVILRFFVKRTPLLRYGGHSQTFLEARQHTVSSHQDDAAIQVRVHLCKIKDMNYQK